MSGSHVLFLCSLPSKVDYFELTTSMICDNLERQRVANRTDILFITSYITTIIIWLEDSTDCPYVRRYTRVFCNARFLYSFYILIFVCCGYVGFVY